MKRIDPGCEWLETNRFGSFAMGTVDRIPRRKYHSLLTVREPGIGEALNVLVDVGEYVEVGDQLFMLNAFAFGEAGERTEPKGFLHLKEFSADPHPRWIYEFEGFRVERSLQLDPETDLVRLYYAFSAEKGKTPPVRVRLRPFIACRPIHKLTHENPFLNGASRVEKQGDGETQVAFAFYEKLPEVRMRASGASVRFLPGGEWVRQVFHATERDRGYEAVEDLYVPGEFELSVAAGKSGELVFEAGVGTLPPKVALRAIRESSPDTLIGRLEGAGEKYLITTKSGFNSVIAGYPWFGHWARDTFISLPGLCIESGDVRRAHAILESYGEVIVEGLTKHGIVCSFPDRGLILTGVDAPLLYIRAVQLLAERSTRTGFNDLMPTVCRVLNALKNCADSRVQITEDGGLFVQPGAWTSTWMDVLQDGQPVTPRAGFAVDINALFVNALLFAVEWARRHDPKFAQEWGTAADRAEASFLQRFWSEEKGYLADSHDGRRPDFSLRPNQLWAIALPFSAISSKAMGSRILAAVRKDLLTPVGLRTLAPSDPRYIGRYQGAHRARDAAYHQGTVWPWLLGIYADAVGKVEGKEQLKKDLGPILKRLAIHMESEGCLGQIAEVFDGDAPHAPGGTPAQAWSVAEVLRVAYALKL